MTGSQTFNSSNTWAD